MFSSSKARERNTPDNENGEIRRPLLGDNENVVFSVDDDDSDEETSGPSRVEHSVRFHEEVEVIAPSSLRSTTASREAGSYFPVSSSLLAINTL